MITIDEVFVEAQKNKRVCPMPDQWKELYEMLPDRRPKGGGYEPSLPLILIAWDDTPAISKILRLREHIEWAASHNCLDMVYHFMRSLPEDHWHHIGD